MVSAFFKVLSLLSTCHDIGAQKSPVVVSVLGFRELLCFGKQRVYFSDQELEMNISQMLSHPPFKGTILDEKILGCEHAGL